MYEEKAGRQLHKNVVSYIEQVLEGKPNKAAAIRPPATHHENYQVRRTKHAGHCWRSKDELISDILSWISSHGRAKVGRASVGRPARTYIQQLCADTGYSLEDLLEAMDDRDGWRERAREICAYSTTWWWWWWWHIFPKCISPKVNVISRLEFELIYYEAAVRHLSHDITNIRRSKKISKRRNTFFFFFIIYYFLQSKCYKSK